MSKTKLLDLTNDVVFQALFGEVGNERITKKLLGKKIFTANKEIR